MLFRSGGSADRETALRIMKDSRLGSYAAMALVLALLLKAGLHTLPTGSKVV